MKKLFVSLPMRGLKKEEIKEKQWQALETVRKLYPNETFILIDTYISEKAPCEHYSGLWYLGESIKRMTKADVVYFCRGAENARGCRIERRCARDYGMTFITETENGWIFFLSKEGDMA